MTPRRLRLVSCALLAGGLALAPGVRAAELKATLITQADDPRLDRARLERAYPGHPGGTAIDGVQLALDDGRFELDAAGTTVSVEAVTVDSPAAARGAAATAAQAGAASTDTVAPAASSSNRPSSSASCTPSMAAPPGWPG